MTDIPEYIQNAMPTYYKMSIYCKLANFNKCLITMWILIFPLWKSYEMHGISDIFMDVIHTLEMTICVVNQLKNDSYC